MRSTENGSSATSTEPDAHQQLLPEPIGENGRRIGWRPGASGQQQTWRDPPIGRSGTRTASDDRPQVRPIGTLPEPAAKQTPVKVAHVTAVNLPCVSTFAGGR